MDINDIGSLGKRMLSIRKQKNLKQTNFSKLIGVSSSYLSLVELDKQRPSLTFIMSVLKATKVNANWLLTGRGPMYLPIKEKKEEIKEINEDRTAYGADKSPSLDIGLDSLKSHWDKLSDEQKKSLMRHVKKMIKNNEMAEENRMLKDFLIKIATKPHVEMPAIPSNVVQGLTD
jgi:transcriptional regulator with XRE-family HTH domain